MTALVASLRLLGKSCPINSSLEKSSREATFHRARRLFKKSFVDDWAMAASANCALSPLRPCVLLLLFCVNAVAVLRKRCCCFAFKLLQFFVNAVVAPPKRAPRAARNFEIPLEQNIRQLSLRRDDIGLDSEDRTML